ncbi:MAG: hypothetical protein VXX04_07390, partial [Actinomycetota bacterium]|nr:hypothetical protein [Actinomycetota bacterium]
LPRLITAALMADSREEARNALWPYNVGTATKDGCGILAHGIRLATEQRPGWVLVNLDVENAHNALLRRVALERIYANPNTRHLLPVYWAHYSPKSRIYFRGTRREVVRAGFDSEEAWRQGCPLAQLGFNVAILPEVKRLDEQLAEHGGFARFNHDDGYAFGPPEVVFKLVEEFEEQISHLGLRLNLDKSRCYSRECDILQHPDYPGGGEDPSFPLTVAFRDQRGAERIDIHPNATGPVLGKGCIVGGVPIGDSEFVRVHLAETVSDAVSKSRNISLMLQSDCLHTLHTLNIRCLQPILSYWTQHCYPVDVLQPGPGGAPSAVAVMDAALLQVACTTQGDFLAEDALLQRRLRLPARHLGGGLRSHENTCHGAFAASVAKIAPK